MQVHASVLIAGLRYAVQHAEKDGEENEWVKAWRNLADDLEQGDMLHVIPTKMPPPSRPKR